MYYPYPLKRYGYETLKRLFYETLSETFFTLSETFFTLSETFLRDTSFIGDFFYLIGDFFTAFYRRLFYSLLKSTVFYRKKDSGYYPYLFKDFTPRPRIRVLPLYPEKALPQGIQSFTGHYCYFLSYIF